MSRLPPDAPVTETKTRTLLLRCEHSREGPNYLQPSLGEVGTALVQCPPVPTLGGVSRSSAPVCGEPAE